MSTHRAHSRAHTCSQSQHTTVKGAFGELTRAGVLGSSNAACYTGGAGSKVPALVAVRGPGADAAVDALGLAGYPVPAGVAVVRRDERRGRAALPAGHRWVRGVLVDAHRGTIGAIREAEARPRPAAAVAVTLGAGQGTCSPKSGRSTPL